MYSTSQMNLTSWDLFIDDFDHTQLDANWKAIDAHDHTTGRGRQIPTAGIQLKAITTALLDDLAVTSAQLAVNAVSTDKIQDQAVTTAKLADDSVTGGQIEAGSITTDKLESTVLPLGTVMMWWRAADSAATPGGGWEIMDGRPWISVPNLLGLTQGNIPNMIGKVARGTDTTNVGTTGGSDTVDLVHSHNVANHRHNIPSHVHSISADGSHIHLWQGGLHMGARDNAFSRDVFFRDAFTNNIVGPTYYSMYIQNLLSNPNWYRKLSNNTIQQTDDSTADMDPAGTHSHGAATGGSGVLMTDLSTSTTDSQLGAASTVPSYVGLVYIMRVR